MGYNKYSENTDDKFEEYLFELGLELVAVKNSNDIPNNKDAFLLITRNKRLKKDLFKWAKLNNVVILFNPDEIEYTHCKSLFAFVIDTELKNDFPFPEFLIDKYLTTNLEIELLEDFLKRKFPKLNFLKVYQ